MTLRQFEPALKCFQKAQGLSPTNLERLVMMAETQAEMGEPVKADESINKAKDIDPDSPTTSEGEAKVALAGGSPEAAKEILGQLESMSNVISYLNNKAVAHAKCGFSEEGIKLYEKTLAAIPSAQRDILAIVNYNMALAKIRFGNLSGALPDLDAVIAITESRVHKKAADLKARLEPAVTTGKSFSLREVDAANAPAPPPSSNSDEGQTADATTLVKVMLEQGPGDHCCYLLFKTTSTDSPELTKALAVAPKFKARKTIERGETFAGADGTKTAS
jgi:tetratricopeptide (TPR) repeat protein